MSSRRSPSPLFARPVKSATVQVPEQEYFYAKPVGRRLKRHIAEACPAHEQFTTKGFKGRYFLRSRKVVWVMAPPEKVITVWPLPENFKRFPRKKRTK